MLVVVLVVIMIVVMIARYRVDRERATVEGHATRRLLRAGRARTSAARPVQHPKQSLQRQSLAARLNAARELRRELRHEAVMCAGTSGATFGDAAARLFQTLGNGERPVNPDALEGCKASCDTSPAAAGTAAGSDARDDL